MQRCLDLARLGLGSVAPNPMVGAVIVHNGAIIGEGYHRNYGNHHAEVEAVQSVHNTPLLADSTLYVNLEPCNHHGKTPACTQLILENNIPHVVVAQEDPNPLVAGSGIKHLQENGVHVTQGVMEADALLLNRRFNTFHQKKRPYIILKWAETSDGFIDELRQAGQPNKPRWITDDYCRSLVHKWRAEESAIMVGSRTALLDNPQLNVRAWTGKNPVRLVIDRKNSLPRTCHLFDQTQATVVFTEQPSESKENLNFINLSGTKDTLLDTLKTLFEMEIQSVIVEGGAQLLQSYIDQNLWDEARVFTGPSSFGDGVKAPQFHWSLSRTEKTGNSSLKWYFNQ